LVDFHFFSMKKPLLGLLLAALTLPILAQNPTLPVAVEVQNAYQKTTRSPDGKPGAAYWQNHSEYQIRARLDPATRRLTGTEKVVYHNESPDGLTQMVIRLYPDIFRKDAVRDEVIDPVDINETGVEVGRVVVNGEELTGKKLQRRGTNLFLTVPRIESKAQATLEIDWAYTLPAKTHIREGTYFNTSFMVAYWYPQIAVYDDIDGWDRLDYKGPQEFYNDFSNFDVEITMPASHLVWATGVWQNPDEILSPTFLERYQRAQTAEGVVNVVTALDRERGGITQNKPTHTYRFRAEKVPDFVFAASDTYLWDMGSVVPEAGRRTAVSAVYHPSAWDFRNIVAYSQQAIRYFSTQLPGIPYPYPNLTVFNGHGGMEFPMFVNDGSFPDEEAAEVVAHEIAHTYFPFYMGINERKYAWMDEGWAQFLPNDIEFSVKGKPFRPQQNNAQYYAYFAGRASDMPMMVPSDQLSGQSYTFASYFRPSQAYSFLRDMLGDDKFKATLQGYMARWNGKHPTPYDFFFSFNDLAGEDLSWYWRPWFFEKGYPDLALGTVTVDKKNRLRARIDQKGTLPLPIRLRVTLADGSVEEVRETARVWQTGKAHTLERSFSQPVRKVELGSLMVPDINRKNNVWEAGKTQ
jgi:hypothetical protein